MYGGVPSWRGWLICVPIWLLILEKNGKMQQSILGQGGGDFSLIENLLCEERKNEVQKKKRVSEKENE